MSDSHERGTPRELRSRLGQVAPSDRAGLLATWHLLGETNYTDVPAPDVDRAWAAVRKRMAEPSARPNERQRSSREAVRRERRPLRRWRSLTAAALVVVGLLLWWSRPVDVRVAPGARLVTTLPDGSLVTLTGGSGMTYRRGFSLLPGLPGQSRHVHLRGEAFFDVAHGERPFVVETFNAYVEVLGTRFEVQAWDALSRPETQVVLASGVVRLTSKLDEAAPVVLDEAGRRARIAPGHPTAAPEATPFDIQRAWRNEGFYATNQSLEAILLRLEQRYSKRIALAPGEAARGAMTLYYPRAVALETILEDICRARGLQFRSIRGGYEIVSRLPESE